MLYTQMQPFLQNKPNFAETQERSDAVKLGWFSALAGKFVRKVPFLLVRFLWASKENEQSPIKQYVTSDLERFM